MQRHTGFGIFLLLLAGFSWWLTQTQDETSSMPPASSASDVDYYLRDLQSVALRIDGQPDRTLYADKARHRLKTDITELDNPVLLIHQINEPPWKIQSETGEIMPEGEWVFLHGEVEITRAAAPPDIRPVQIYTRNVRVRPEQAYVETDEFVKAYRQQDWTQAVGMRGWLKEPATIKLLQKVKSFYAPPPT